MTPIWEKEIDKLMPTACRVKSMLGELRTTMRLIEEDPDATLDDLCTNVRELESIATALRKRVIEEVMAIEEAE